MNKITITILISLFSFSLLHGQENESNAPSFTISRGDVIWAGMIDVTSNKEYYLNGSVRQTNILWDIRRLKMINSMVGVGFQTQNSIYINDFFDGFQYSYFSLGPVVRTYLYRYSKFVTYTEAAMLLGYDMALADALGNSQNGGLRVRRGLKVGTSYLLSKKAGLFFEIGPDWEGKNFRTIDSKAIQLKFGISLIN